MSSSDDAAVPEKVHRRVLNPLAMPVPLESPKSSDGEAGRWGLTSIDGMMQGPTLEQEKQRRQNFQRAEELAQEQVVKDSGETGREPGSARRALRAVVLHPAFDWVVLARAHHQLSKTDIYFFREVTV